MLEFIHKYYILFTLSKVDRQKKYIYGKFPSCTAT